MGGLAIIPATIIVIWQVEKESRSKQKEEQRIREKELKRIEKNHTEEIKKVIFELLACMNKFPNLFEIRYRVAVIN